MPTWLRQRADCHCVLEAPLRAPPWPGPPRSPAPARACLRPAPALRLPFCCFRHLAWPCIRCAFSIEVGWIPPKPPRPGVSEFLGAAVRQGP